jgi:hypothetical protein
VLVLVHTELEAPETPRYKQELPFTSYSLLYRVSPSEQFDYKCTAFVDITAADMPPMICIRNH